jgi:hypothetical protein
MNEHDDEIGGGGRVDPEAAAALSCEPDETEPDQKGEKWFATSRQAMRGYRFGLRADKPDRSRCQRKTAKQRQHGPTGKALEHKQKRRDARILAWLAAEREWAEAAA